MGENKQLTAYDDQKNLIKVGGAKFKRWCSLFLDPKSETYGNATKSALKAYKTKKYFNAAAIGHQNYKKLQNLGVGFAEIDGVTIRDWFKIAASKAVDGSYEQTIDYMERMGIIDKGTVAPANQINQQFNFGDLVDEMNKTRQERGLPVEGEND